MLAPLSWLKEYVDITLPPKELAERLTEVGLSVEKITKAPDDVIFELEITPNRPDCLSILGVAREIATIEGEKIRYPKFKTNLKPSSHLTSGSTKNITIKTNSKINPRFTGIIIADIKVEESPKWLKERLMKMGQRSINNIVDVTNYVMLELGSPIHAFDYDKIVGSTMTVSQTKGGEKFESVDETSYHLPKDAVIISDKEKIIDLCGIKGGKNSGTYENTKTIFIRVPVEIPNLTRRASLSLGLRSDASNIFERGVNSGGTVEALRRCVDLVLEIAGGEVASELFDLKGKSFKPWKLNLRLGRLNQILGIEIPVKKVTDILESLNLSPRHLPGQERRHLEGGHIECTIPTYRNDLKIEEDLIEEIARFYGYNNFPKTMPLGQVPVQQVPYFKDYRIDEKVKNILTSAGFSEVYTYSLISENDIESIEVHPEKILRIDNPVSREFEYLRPTLKANLIKAFLQNRPHSNIINLFELGKVYVGSNLDSAKEHYFLSGISNNKSFFEVKGIIERLYEDLGIKEDPTKYIEILNKGVFFEVNYSEMLNKINLPKKFTSLAKYPGIYEDLATVAKENVKTGDLIDEIKKQSPLITSISLLDQFENTRTFHIVYQHKERNLTNDEVSKIRSKILKSLNVKFHATLKE